MKYHQWSEAEVKLLKDLHSEGLESKTIADILARECGTKLSDSQIRSRVQRLIASGEVKKKSRGRPKKSKADKAATLVGKRNLNLKEDTLSNAVLSLLMKKPMSITEISNELDRAESTVRKIVNKLKKAHYQIEVTDSDRALLSNERKPEISEIKVNKFYSKKRVKFGSLACTHIGSRYQQTSMMNAAYDIFEKEKVDFVCHSGDFVDGIDVYRGQEHETWSTSADDQVGYAIDHYPKKKGIKTYAVMGNHDESYIRKAGFDPVSSIAAERSDIEYLGQYAGTLKLNNLGINLMLMHGAGGMAYAKSYKTQKITEGIMGHIVNMARQNEESISSIAPIAMLIGHWHTFCYVSHMGTDVISVPCLQGQTPFLRRRGWQPDLEVLVVEMALNKHAAVQTTWKRFDLSSLMEKDNY